MIDLVRFILRGHKWGIILIILFGLGTVATNLVFIWLSKCVIDIAAHQRAGSIHTFSAALVITLALQVLFRVISVRLTNYTGAKMSNAVQSKVFAHLLYTRWSNLGQMHSGDMVVRMLKDTDGLVTFFVSSLPTAILAAAQLLGALCLLYYFNPTLALILGVGMPLLAIFSKVYYKRMRHYTDEMKQAESEITAQIQETLLNQTVIRTFERQATSIDHLLMRQGKYLRAVKRQTLVSVFANLLMQGAFSSGYIVAFLWSARGLYGGTITFGLMTSFLQLVARIQSPLTTLIGILPSLISSKSSLDRLVNLLEFKTEQTGRSVQLTGPVRLQIKDMSFRYAEDEDWVYQHFSLEASSGEMIALMGRTGAGKTTLLRLLLGLVPPTEGTISDGHLPSERDHPRELRLRPSGRIALQRYDTRQSPHRGRRGHRCRSQASTTPSGSGLCLRSTQGTRYGHRGARSRALRRASTAHRHRSCPAAPREDPSAGRSDLRPRPRYRSPIPRLPTSPCLR